MIKINIFLFALFISSQSIAGDNIAKASLEQIALLIKPNAVFAIGNDGSLFHLEKGQAVLKFDPTLEPLVIKKLNKIIYSPLNRIYFINRRGLAIINHSGQIIKPFTAFTLKDAAIKIGPNGFIYLLGEREQDNQTYLQILDEDFKEVKHCIPISWNYNTSMMFSKDGLVYIEGSIWSERKILKQGFSIFDEKGLLIKNIDTMGEPKFFIGQSDLLYVFSKEKGLSIIDRDGEILNNINVDFQNIYSFDFLQLTLHESSIGNIFIFISGGYNSGQCLIILDKEYKLLAYHHNSKLINFDTCKTGELCVVAAENTECPIKILDGHGKEVKRLDRKYLNIKYMIEALDGSIYYESGGLESKIYHYNQENHPIKKQIPGKYLLKTNGYSYTSIKHVISRYFINSYDEIDVKALRGFLSSELIFNVFIDIAQQQLLLNILKSAWGHEELYEANSRLLNRCEANPKIDICPYVFLTYIKYLIESDQILLNFPFEDLDNVKEQIDKIAKTKKAYDLIKIILESNIPDELKYYFSGHLDIIEKLLELLYHG